MNLGELRTEVLDRGFNYLLSPRVDSWLNRIYHRICEYQGTPWPFLEVTATGTSPLTIADLRNVLSVVDSTGGTPLVWEDLRTIRERDPELDDTGNPTSWYRDGETVTAHPVSTNSLSVRYIMVPTDLSADEDVPVIPSRYHYALVDGAVAMAYEDSDNFDAAQMCWQSFSTALEEMVVLLTPNYDTPDEIVTTDASTDW